jgi:hypothetical protein
VPHDAARFGKSLTHRALKRVHGVVDGFNRGRRIDAAVKKDNDPAGGLAHAHIVDVAQATLRGGRSGERGLDAEGMNA